MYASSVIISHRQVHNVQGSGIVGVEHGRSAGTDVIASKRFAAQHLGQHHMLEYIHEVSPLQDQSARTETKVDRLKRGVDGKAEKDWSKGDEGARKNDVEGQSVCRVGEMA